MKTLHLTLRRKPFDLIRSGEKLEEYREIKRFWIQRLCDEVEYENGGAWEGVFKKFDRAEMRNGYSKDAPTLRKKVKGIRIGKPREEWADGMDCSKDVFIIDLEPGAVRFCFECGDQLDKEELYCSYCRLQS